MFRPLKPYQLVVDVSAAVLLLIAALLADLAARWMFLPTSAGSGGWQVLPVIAIFSAALALRRTSPTLALAGVWVGALLQMALDLSPLLVNISIFGVLYAAAAYGTRLVMWLGFASAIVGASLISIYLVYPSMLRGGLAFADVLRQYLTTAVAVWVAATFALLLSWTVGALVRTALRARANREAQLRAQEEAIAEHQRTTIARDMHDVVAHSLAVVIAQADGARYAAASDPEAAASALATISTTARAALADVRLLLTQLRHSQAEGPQPTLADLETLYAQVRAAGVPLRVDVDPTPRTDPPAAVQLALYRIVQEALTNALRHGDGGEVAVSLAWHPARVDLTVRNGARLAHVAGVGPAEQQLLPGEQAPGAAHGGAPDTEHGAGHGVIGMRERAQLAGGTLSAAHDGGEFVVEASIPLQAAPAGAHGMLGAGATA